MTPLYGRAPIGQRLPSLEPLASYKSQTFIAGLRCDELVAPWTLDGAMNKACFLAYLETQLGPTLPPRSVVIMDNLSSHKVAEVAQTLARFGAWPLYLPPYRPDWNPIEMAFSKIKAQLRRANARTLDALWSNLADICNMFTPTECWNFYTAAGYEPT